MPQASSLPAWASLQSHRDTVGKSFVLKEAFAKDPERFEKYKRVFTLSDSASSCPGSTDILWDFSKNFLADETLDLLTQLAKEAKLEEKREAMFKGEKINFTEGRAVYHTALRNVGNDTFEMKVDDVDVMNNKGGVNEVLKHMKEFSEQVRSGEWKGFTGKKLTNVINIGIGGSDLYVTIFCARRAHCQHADAEKAVL
jgi:glucose-6-phosphate isomerase